MSDARDGSSMDRLSDRMRIVDLTLRMIEHVDLLQWDRLHSCLTEDLSVNYSYVLGNGLTELTAEEFIEQWQRTLGGFEATQHMVTNHRVAFEDSEGMTGDTARCTAYFQAQHFYPDDCGGSIWTLGGHYDFETVREDDGWRISELAMTGLWATGNRHLLQIAADRSVGSSTRFELGDRDGLE